VKPYKSAILKGKRYSMIRTFIAHTAEIDEADDAVSEILNQIDLKKLSKNSIGILACYYEFIETGIVKKLCEALPFGVIGLTTMASTAGGESGMYQLTLTVLTSDEVSFETALTAPLSITDFKNPIESAYREARNKLPSDPAFIISIFPFVMDLSVADVLKSFDIVCGGLPIWGSVVSDVTMAFENSQVILNGQIEKSSLAMVLIHGPVEPEFIVTSLPERNISIRKAVITDSDGCILKKANNVILSDYFDSIDLSTRKGVNPTAVPLMVSYDDGSAPVALAIYSMREDGTALCGGEMPLGGTFSIGEIDSKGIRETANTTIEKVLACGKSEGILMFPCISRYLMLAPNSSDEMEAVFEKINGKIPYWLAYSGGEICPIRGEDGKYHNRLHNYSFPVCVL
jgi:hypothetical protein